MLCNSLKYFLVYALKCFMKFRLLHFSFSGILRDVYNILSYVEAWKCICVLAWWQYCDKSEYSSYSAGGLACPFWSLCLCSFTLLFQCRFLKWSLWFPILTHLIGPLCCLLFPRTKLQLLGHHFQDIPENYEQLLTVPHTHRSKKSVPLVLPAVAEIIGTVHKLGRGTTWKERTVTSKKSKHTICYCLSPGTFRYVLVLYINLSSSITITVLITSGTNCP